MGLRVLSVLDTTKVQYYHFKAIIIAGMGLFTDSYDLFCIGPVTILLGRIYYPNNEDMMIPPVVLSTMLGVALLGTIIGQLVFGRLGDLIGRRRVYGIALALMVLSSFGCGFSLCTSRSCVLVSFSFFRFILGIGIGGDYPLSATIMSEFANKTTRGAFIAAVFSMQGLGILFGSTVIMVVCAIFDRVTDASPDHTPKVADLAWRIILMMGAVPAAITFYWRMMMPESARYTALVERNVVQAAKDMEKVIEVSMAQMMEETSSGTTPLIIPPPPTYPLFSKQFLQHHGRDLFSCAATWLIVDIIFYSNTLLQSLIYEFDLPKPHEVNVFQEAYNVARFQAILAVCSTIPGYWATVFFIDKIGRRKIQILGFALMAVGLFATGGPYYSLWDGNNKNSNGVSLGFMILFGLILFFCNFGPNTTTFIVPAELFPARFRTTCHGISGAFGKVGAIIGAIGFLWASHKKKTEGYPKALGMEKTLMILGVISLVGAVVTYFFTPETNGRSLEENELEHDESANGNASVNV